MSSIDSLIRENIEKNGLFSNCSGVVLAVSGGSDSMTLLDYFIREVKNIPFAVAHVNHGLREESGAEEEFVKSYCENHLVKCEICKADIPNTKPAGVTTEEYSRTVRYSFFEKTRKKFGYSHIATAHNKKRRHRVFFYEYNQGRRHKRRCGNSSISF